MTGNSQAMFRSWWVALPILLASSAAVAAVPTSSVLEGTLTSAGGGPAADGSYALTFTLYKDAVDVNPLWQEGPVQVAVKSGAFAYTMGVNNALKADALAAGDYIAFKVGNDPELPRKPLSSVLYALRASVAEGIDCSGCISAAALDPKSMAVYAKKADISTVATTGNYSDLNGKPALSTVASSGNYSDLVGAPPLGKMCGSNLVVAGFNADGSLNCVAGGGANGLPADGIDEISNGLIWDQFTDKYTSGNAPITIKDYFPPGTSDTINVPDVGVAQKLTVSLQLVNSDISGITVYLYDPNNVEYKLFDKNGKAGDGIVTSYPDNTKPASGDLTAWINKNPKGAWILKVVDNVFNPATNPNDGQILSWAINVQTLSSKKIQIKGDLIVDGNVTVGGVNPLIWPTYRYAVWSTYDQWSGNWFGGDNTSLFGGINPSVWTDGNGVAKNLNPDKNFLRTLFNKTGKIYPNLNVYADTWYNNSSTNGKMAAALFRVNNTTANDINWPITFFYTAYQSWGEQASVTLNGAGSWQSSNDCGAQCSATVNLLVPKNRVSTVVVIVGSSGPSGTRSTFLGFYNNTLKLPVGLSYVDDLDTATGDWTQ